MTDRRWRYDINQNPKSNNNINKLHGQQQQPKTRICDKLHYKFVYRYHRNTISIKVWGNSRKSGAKCPFQSAMGFSWSQHWYDGMSFYKSALWMRYNQAKVNVGIQKGDWQSTFMWQSNLWSHLVVEFIALWISQLASKRVVTPHHSTNTACWTLPTQQLSLFGYIETKYGWFSYDNKSFQLIWRWSLLQFGFCSCWQAGVIWCGVIQQLPLMCNFQCT